MNSFFHLSLAVLICGCVSSGGQEAIKTYKTQFVSKPSIKNQIISRDGKTIATRFVPPLGYKRIALAENSFGQYLRTLPLKAHGEAVMLFNKTKKTNQNAHIAVVDLPIGKRDLHQCADAIIRLKAEYLYKQKRYDDIHFNFTNGFKADYNKWVKGERIVVNGNKCSWRSTNQVSSSYTNFWKYMEMVFSYAGTLSLSKELNRVSPNNMKVGDVFIQGGSPGHAIIVIDMLQNTETDKKLFLLAQSYMPAQEIQILKNPNDQDLSPWYSADFEGQLITPEWRFYARDLKRFKQ